MAGLLPGFGLATVIAPRWPAWERLVVAPGLSAGLIGVLGLAMHLVHLSFSPATVLPLVALIGVAGFLRFRAARRDPAAEGPAGSKAAVRRVVVLGLTAGIVSAGGLALSLNGQPLPPDWDPPEHGALVNAIVQSHDVYPTFSVPLEHTTYVRPRMAFEATAAVVSELHGPPPAMSMMPLIFLALLLMPLGLAMLALETTGSYWVAGLTPLLSTGMAFPAFQVTLGRFPLVLDATLVAAAVVAMARLVRGRDVYVNAAMIAAITAAIWVTHGLEALTAALIGGPLVIELLLRGRSLASLLRAGAGIAAAAVGAGLVTVLSRAPRGPAVAPALVELASSEKIIGLFGGSFGPRIHPHLIFEYFAQTNLSSPIALCLLAIGVVAVVARRELLWALASLLLLLLALADVIYPQSLKYFWQSLVWPWGEVDRLLGLAYWLAPMLMAFGLVWSMQLALKASRQPRAWTAVTIAAVVLMAAAVAIGQQVAGAWTSLFLDQILLFPFGHNNRLIFLAPFVIPMAGVATIAAIAWVALRLAPSATRAQPRWRTLASPPIVAVLATVAMLSLGIGALQELRTYFNNNYYRQLATNADVAVMDQMSRTLPAGSRVMTDSLWDAGMWVAALTNDRLLVPKEFVGGELSRPLVLALADACTKPEEATRVLASFDAVFVGAHRIPKSPDAWDSNCIGALPGLREIARAGAPGAEAHAYQVIRPDG